jgi:dTDP-4-amino-4,6-dideoxygalactose transaminase
MMNIPSMRIYIPKEDRESLTHCFEEIIDSKILTEGKYCKELEKQLSEYLGVKHIVVTNSGTGALELVLRAMRLSGEVVVPTETFSATLYAVLRAGCKPVLADCEDDMYLSPNDVKRRITNNTKAVLVMHVGGHISESIEELLKLCEQHTIPLIEDAAQAAGSRFQGLFACNLGEGAACSFFPTKVIGSAEGGFAAFKDDEVAERARLIKDQGKSVGNYCTVQGYNWRMNEFQAALALSQLKRVEDFIKHREGIARLYDKRLEEFSGATIKPLVRSHMERPNWYKYICFLLGADREKLKARLRAKQISLSGEVYEIPCHIQPAFEDLQYKRGDFPIAERVCATHICFPMTSELTIEQANYFIDSLKEELA